MVRHSRAEQTRNYRCAHRRQSLSGLHSFLRAFRRSPLGVWVEEGLKEEIAGGRGPRRPSQRPHDEKLWEYFLNTARGTMVTGTKPQMYNVTGPRQADRTRPDPTGPQKISNQRKMNAPKCAPSYGWLQLRSGAPGECVNKLFGCLQQPQRGAGQSPAKKIWSF